MKITKLVGIRLGGERGSSFVEIALIMPLFVTLLVGAVEFGQLANDWVVVSNAAMAGASYGARSHATASDTTNIELAATTDGSNLSGMTATTSHSCTCSDGTAISCATAVSLCLSPARIEEFVQVNTSATISTTFRLPGVPTSYTLKGQAILRVEQ
jgi:Flp pilus assembly protein TadG